MKHAYSSQSPISILSLLAVFLFLLPSTTVMAQRNAQDYQRLGRNAFELRNYDKAVRYLSKAIDMNPLRGAYYQDRGEANLASGNFREAYRDFSTALHYSVFDKPRKAVIYHKRGLCRYNLKQYKEALSEFDHSIRLNPSSASPYYFRGKIFQLVYHKPNAAAREFEKVLKLSTRKSLGSKLQYAYSLYFLGRESQSETYLLNILNAARRENNEYEVMVANYCLAGLEALRGNEAKSLRYLDETFRLGFKEWFWLATDLHFDKIRYSRNYSDLVASYAYPNGEPPDHRPGYQVEETFAMEDIKLENLEFSDQNNNGRIDPAEDVYMVFQLRNSGSVPARDLSLRVVESSALSGLEYPERVVVGRLEPGESIRFTIPVEGTRELEMGQANFTISLVDGNQRSAELSFLSIATQNLMPPRLTIKDIAFGTANDEALKRGVPIQVHFSIENQGEGIAKDVAVEFELPGETFSTGKKNFILGNIEPGEKKVVEFEFFTGKWYSSTSVPLALAITEATGKYNGTEVLTAYLGQSPDEEGHWAEHNAGQTGRSIGPKEPEMYSSVDDGYPHTLMDNPDAVAVVIGNSNYQNLDVPRVDFAIRDAEAVKNYLVHSFGFDENNIIYLQDASQADFNKTFGRQGNYRARLYNIVKPGESDVFVYYAGHGVPDPVTEEAYFMPVNGDPALIDQTGYSLATLYKNLSDLEYRSLTVVIDACFSGQAEGGSLIKNVSPIYIKPKITILHDENAIVLTAGRGTELASWYPEEYHSLFTYYFLKGLQGDANTDNNRILTLGELRNYLEDQVAPMARRLNNRVQNPEIYGNDEKELLLYE